jgi:hypothetical protein
LKRRFVPDFSVEQNAGEHNDRFTRSVYYQLALVESSAKAGEGMKGKVLSFFLFGFVRRLLTAHASALVGI